jgi:threonine dehydrogenase-like Zn-dependent dehydrogenase
MKLFASLIALCAIAQNVGAFSVQTGFRSRTSSLSMTVETNEKIKIVKVGVIGCGRIGLVHLEAITKAPGVNVVIVSNPTVSKAENGKNDES